VARGVSDLRNATLKEAWWPEARQEKRDNFFVCEPIFNLKPGEFAHVHGASVGHLSLTKQKRAEAPEFMRVFLRRRLGLVAFFYHEVFFHALCTLVLWFICDDWSTPALASTIRGSTCI
jgi:hypothetical protein